MTKRELLNKQADEVSVSDSETLTCASATEEDASKKFGHDLQFADSCFHQKKKHSKYKTLPVPVCEFEVADTHCHMQILDKPAQAFARCAVNGVSLLCDIFDIADDKPDTIEFLQMEYSKAKDLLADMAAATALCYEEQVWSDALLPKAASDSFSLQLPQLVFAVGVHPHNARFYTDEMEVQLRAYLQKPEVRVLGEVGLDFYYDMSPRDVQEEVFRRQIRVAHEMDMPLSLHIRDAHKEALRIMDEEGFPEAGVILHCFNLGPEEVKPWVERDCYIAFGGPLTFKAADYTREAAKLVPHTRLLTETDTPFMTPEPVRGVCCLPDHSLFTATELATICVGSDSIARKQFLMKLMDNAKTVFQIKD